jgi:rubrerythrin
MKFNSLKESLEYAIKQEEIAASLYRHLAKISQTVQVREEFLNLVKMEEGHKESLESFSFETYKQRTEEEIYFNLGTTDVLVEPTNKNLSELSFTDALILAAKREHAAVLMYQKFAEVYSDNEILRKFFLNMVEEESRHKYDLESKYEDVINER